MDAKTVLAAARFRLTQPGHAPYLNAIAWALHFVPKDGIGTVGVSEDLRCYYDPKVVEQWGVEHMEAVLVHECHHVVRAHMRRKPPSAPAMPWNVAGDAEINDDLRREGWALPDGDPFPIVFPERLHPPMPEGLTAEEYFAAMAKQHEQDKSEAGDEQSDKDGPHCGGASGHPDPWEDAPTKDSPGVGDLEQEILRRKVAEAVKQCQQRGEGAGGLERWADDLLNPKVDWRKELGALVKNSIARMSGPDDFTYRKPNRRRHSGNLILPATVSPIPKVAVVIDTSGSMGDRQLGECLAEVKGVLDVACGRAPVTVLAVDDAVHSSKAVWSAKKVGALKGGGGTDMGKGIAAAMKERPDVCIVLTDGYTPWPDKKPNRMQVVVGLIGGHKGNDVPSYARKLVIGGDD